MPVALSVNVNKVATLRNARGGNSPNLIEACKFILSFPVHGITVHPRPDERHIRYQDVYDLKKILPPEKELNIEGNPKEKKFIDLVLAIKPHQVTLVPDGDEQITSDHGWDTIKEFSYLKEIIAIFKNQGIRTSIFIDPNVEMIEHSVHTNTDRLELYTESYAKNFSHHPQKAIQPFVETAKKAIALGIELNAGHDLSLENLAFFVKSIPQLKEVSIGHALISDALYLGLEKTIAEYLAALKVIQN